MQFSANQMATGVGLEENKNQKGFRILHVIRSLDPAWGGPTQGVKHITGQGLARGHMPEIVALDDPNSNWINKYEAPVHALGTQNQVYGYSPALVKWLNANLSRFDRVVVHGVWHYHSYAVWKAARKFGIPYYLFTHGYLDPWFQTHYPLKHIKKVLYWKTIEHRVLRDAKAVLFTSEEEMRLASHSFRPYKCNPIVIGYGTPPPPDVARQKDKVIQRLTDMNPVMRGRDFILFLARIHEKKGIDLLIEAFKAAKSSLPNTALVIAGDGNPALIAQLKKLSSDQGLQDEIVWCGPIYDEFKWSVMSAAQAFVLPSHQENFGISVAEALACGTPVLISDKVNIWREIEAGNGGFVGSDDLRGTTEVLKKWGNLAVESKDAMRSYARLCFENHFNITTTADRIFNCFREC